MKRFLAISLTVLMMLSMVSVFAEGTEGEDASTGTEVPGGASAYVVNENFNDGDVSQWGEDAVFSSSDYGYLEFTATEANGILTRQWDNTGATELTVDFRIKAVTEGENATVSLNVAGAALTLTPASDTLCWGAENAGIATIIPKLWYDVRVAIKDNEEQNAKVANVWVDGKAYDTTIAVDAISDSFTATLANGETIGIDDFKVYNGYKDDGLKSTALDFKFDGFELKNNTVTSIQTPTVVSKENMKSDNMTFAGGTEGTAPIYGKVFRKDVFFDNKFGLFGKDKNDQSVYYNNIVSDGASNFDSSVEFSIGEHGRLQASGDKQVISFNMAFTTDAPKSFIVRSRNWDLKDGEFVADGLWGGVYQTTNTNYDITDGWVMKILGDRMYLFGSDKYYSINPALLPNAWNNIRLEITSQSDGTNAAIYSAYVNNNAVAENIPLTVAQNIVHQGTTYSIKSARNQFWGIHNLIMNYNWTDAPKVAGGIYLDDIKIENYYANAEYDVEPSPMLKAEGGSLQNFEWAVNKYVQGSVVYVDENQKLSDYEKSLDSKENERIIEENGNVRFIEAIFRDKDGNILDKESTFGVNEVYGEFIKNDYTRTYATFVSGNKELTYLAGDETGTYEAGADDVYPGDFNGWYPANKSEWQGDFYTETATGAAIDSITSISGLGAKKTEDVFLSVNAKTVSGTENSRRRIRYALTPEYSADRAYTYSAPYRPITIEFSILLENQSDAARLMFWRSEGPYSSKDVSGNTVEARKQNGMMFFTYNSTTGQNEIRLKATGGEFVSNYNVGEWNRIAVSYYPGYHQFRLDVSVNGKLLKSMWKYQNSTEEASNSMLAQVINAIQFDTNSKATSNVYLDDVKIFTGYYDHAPETPALISADDDIVIEKDTKSIVLKDSKTKAELLNALADSSVDEILGVYKTRSYVGENVTVADTDLLSVGNIVAIQKGEIIEYYEIAENKFTFKQGSTEIAGDLTEGTKINVSAYARSATAKLIVAQYDANRKLVEDGITIADASSGVAKANSVEVKAGAKIVKAMLWDGFANIAPELVSEERKVIEAPVAEETE